MPPLKNLESIDLIKLPIGVTQILDDFVVLRHGLEIEQYRDEMLSAMVYQLKTYILAEEIDKRTKVVRFSHKFPSNWWQHFKRDNFPNWLLRKFPVNYWEYVGTKKVTFRKYASYPKANILFPDKVGSLIKFRSFINEE